MLCSEQTTTPKIFKLIAPREACHKYQCVSEVGAIAFKVCSNVDGSMAAQGKVNLVSDVAAGNKRSGTTVLLYAKHGGPNQVWVASLGEYYVAVVRGRLLISFL